MEIDNQKDYLLEYVRKASPPLFLLKTYMLVEDPDTNDIVSWNKEGTAFVVWRPAEFASELLPTLFKHSNFSSFVRQLNTYGFRKISTSRWEFSNDMFRRDERDQLCEIRRKKACSNKPQPNVRVQPEPAPKDQPSGDDDRRSSSTSSSSEFVNLVDENKKLKQENGVLSFELMSTKKKCKELLDLVVMYNGGNLERENIKSIEDEKNEGPKLFGVRLEVEGKMENKRKRAEISEGARVIYCLNHANNFLFCGSSEG